MDIAAVSFLTHIELSYENAYLFFILQIAADHYIVILTSQSLKQLIDPFWEHFWVSIAFEVIQNRTWIKLIKM